MEELVFLIALESGCPTEISIPFGFKVGSEWLLWGL